MNDQLRQFEARIERLRPLRPTAACKEKIAVKLERSSNGESPVRDCRILPVLQHAGVWTAAAAALVLLAVGLYTAQRSAGRVRTPVAVTSPGNEAATAAAERRTGENIPEPAVFRTCERLVLGMHPTWGGVVIRNDRILEPYRIHCLDRREWIFQNENAAIVRIEPSVEIAYVERPLL